MARVGDTSPSKAAAEAEAAFAALYDGMTPASVAMASRGRPEQLHRALLDLDTARTVNTRRLPERSGQFGPWPLPAPTLATLYKAYWAMREAMDRDIRLSLAVGRVLAVGYPIRTPADGTIGRTPEFLPVRGWTSGFRVDRDDPDCVHDGAVRYVFVKIVIPEASDERGQALLRTATTADIDACLRHFARQEGGYIGRDRLRQLPAMEWLRDHRQSHTTKEAIEARLLAPDHDSIRRKRGQRRS